MPRIGAESGLGNKNKGGSAAPCHGAGPVEVLLCPTGGGGVEPSP